MPTATKPPVFRMAPPVASTQRHLLWGPTLLLFLVIASIAMAFVAISPNEPLPVETRTHTSPIGYTLELPADWVASRFEGHDEFRPRGLPSLAIGGETFAIDIATRELFLEVPCTLADGVLEMSDGIVADGCTSTSPDASRHDWFLAAPATASDDILIHVIGSTAQLWDTHHAAALQVLASLGIVADPSVARGSFAAGIPMDRYAVALTGFLEARVLGNGATYWMTSEAESLYLESRSTYADIDGNSWSSYVVSQVRGVDANSVEFSFVLRSDEHEVVETVGIGPGVNVGGVGLPAVIRFGGTA